MRWGCVTMVEVVQTDRIAHGRATCSGWPARAPALCAAVVAILVAATGLALVDLAARRAISASVRAVAPQEFQLKTLGSALQRAALGRPDLLPIYGSSDLVHELPIGDGPERYSLSGPFTPDVFFRDAPSGFAVFPLGRYGWTPIPIFQALAADGAELRGRKVVISISPTWFYRDDTDHEQAYEGNFSALHAARFAFDADVSFELKREVARRMLRFPRSLDGQPLITFGLERLAGGSTVDRAVSYAVIPLGKLQAAILAAQDRWQTLVYLRSRGEVAPVEPSQPREVDWESATAQAEQEAARSSDSNRFGFDNRLWALRGRSLAARRSSGQGSAFVGSLWQTQGLDDFDLLLRGLQELGAKPLIISMPLPGPFLEYTGITYAARRGYYRAIRSLVERYGVPLVDFADHDGDRLFVVDPSSHPSQKGWVFYDRALDSFYHDRPSGARPGAISEPAG